MELISYFIDFFIHLNTHLAEILDHYGTLTYAILFLIIFCETGLVIMPLLPGDSLLFAAGALSASTGKLDVYVLIALLLIAALLGDNVNYLVGKFLGTKIKAKENIGFFKREYLENTEAYYEKYGGRTVIMARFIPIVRTIAPFVAGGGNMHYPRYLIFCITGACLWVGGLITLGYLFGNLDVVKKNFEVVILGIIVISVLPLLYQFWNKKQQKSN